MDYARDNRAKCKPGTTLRGQATIEFTFCIFIIFLFVYSFIKIFQWTGIGLAERGQIHDKVLTRNIVESASGPLGPRQQIDPFFYKQRKMRAVWGE